MYYTVYKITNTINGKYYIGMHQTHDLNDGYMGSGKRLRNAIQKYGLDKFTKEILFVFDNEQDMRNKEKELVVLSENTYNLCDGGKGGFGYINKNSLNLRTGAVWTDEMRQNMSKKKLGFKHTEETKQKLREHLLRTKEIRARKASLTLKGRPKSLSHRQKISESLSGKKGIKHNKITCPHCQKLGGERAMKRWHFDNCKSRM